jgi:hypothetical protein
MPQEAPTAAQVWEGEITFCSIDTDLFQSAGFRFGEGVLHQLPKVLPASMGLQLSEVVVREVTRHRMKPVYDALEQRKRAAGDLVRLTGVDLAALETQFNALDIADRTAKKLGDEVYAYAEQCRGGVLPIEGADALGDLFDHYFDGLPPFEQRRDKQKEFPDAMSLWLLERHANENRTKGIIASRDQGWAAFAAGSEYLYCVDSIDKLISLFSATDAHARSIAETVAGATNDAGSALRARLTDALRDHFGNATWDTGDVYSGSGRIEAEVYDTDIVEYTLEGDLQVWPATDDPTTWVVELTASAIVEVYVSVSFYAWDSIDREDVPLGSQTERVRKTIEVDAFLTCSDVRLEGRPEDWHIEIEIGPGRYSVGGLEVEVDLSRD